MSAPARILVVDDERSVRESLSKWFAEEGYEVGTADGANTALGKLAEGHWDIALVDIKMPGTDGVELQGRMREIDPEMATVMITAYASVETAVTALKNGAYDYITKPLDPDEISHLVRKVLEHARASRENRRLREMVTAEQHEHMLIGQSGGMRRVRQAIETVAPTDATVLITGDSGTGKELVAKTIHAMSPRRYHPLVAIHCAALPETLLESELFGHEKGAFTGAQFRKKGKFEIAEGGTVFLDEIGDISLKSQTDLLRVLQEREICRIGGNQPIEVDFRCIAATNKDLNGLIEEGKFRPDLYYRLNVFHIHVPALRERREDIALLAEHFLKKFAASMNKRVERIAPDAAAALNQRDWPGNARELENAVERAMVVCSGGELRLQDFLLDDRNHQSEARRLDDVERAHVLRVLEECNGNQSQAARVLGIDRVTLHHKLKRYGWKRAAVAVGDEDN
jgi:two-component system, NtrC family, response regulator HydG